MKVKVNEKCIGCGTCVSLTNSEIFDYNNDGLAEAVVDVVPADKEDVVVQSKNFCPAPDGGAIEILDGE